MTDTFADAQGDPEGEFIAHLISPDDYAHQVNQVATVWSRQLRYIRRREFALKAFGVEIIPMSAVRQVAYRKELAMAPFVLGVLCLAIVALVFVASIPGGTQIPVGALALAGFAGYTWIRGVKRHRLDFVLSDRTLTWRSKAGDFNVRTPGVAKVVAFAHRSGLLSLDSKFPVQ